MTTAATTVTGRLPRLDRLSALQDAAKWLAIATMVVDHVGAVLLPDAWGLRVVGRVSWPLFALLVGVNLGARGIPAARYVPRLVAWAVPAQLAFLLLGWPRFSILVTLALGVVAWGVITGQLRSWHALWLCLAPWTEYGPAGVLLVPLLAMLSVRGGLLLGSAALLLTLSSQGSFLWAVTTYVAVAALAVGVAVTAYALERRPLGASRLGDLVELTPRVPRWFAYSFYPAHLLLLAALSAVAPAVAA